MPRRETGSVAIEMGGAVVDPRELRSMAKRKNPSRFRAIRPATENLEERQLLAGIVAGVDTAGDAWTLQLLGPGSIQVTKQPDASGNATALTDPSEINTIRIFGTDPLHTRLVGTVVPSGKGTGQVFFETLTEVTNPSDKGTGGNGLLSIDMPQFYLGLTANTAPTTTSPAEPSISIPDGVATLDFGGVDTTFAPNASSTLSTNAQNNQLTVSLGIPQYAGTRIIMNKVVTNSVPSTTTGGTAHQNGVTFNVQGRLGIFQANEIDGSTTNAPAPFATNGGTLVSVQTATAAGAAGPIGSVRVGTNATNFSVVTPDKINTFFVGGETSNVNLLAATGSRNLYFGKGMDTVTIETHTIERLFANRGAINSNVTSDRQIGNIEFGGDVVGTTILSGYNQSLASAVGNPSTLTTPSPDAGGQIRANIAGSVTNSVFASSVVAGSAGFGSSDDLKLPLGTINARIQGSINNSEATPQSPTAAFFAQSLKLTKGPVVPPAIPEAPYSGPLTPASLPGIPAPYAYARPHTAGTTSRKAKK
jgi:hypothetical protein